MTDVTVKSLAAEIQTPVDRLVQQFADAGIDKSEADSVTQHEKETLLAHLNGGNSNATNKLTLQRKTRSTLNVPSTGGKSKSVQIEVRKKRTYVKRDMTEAELAQAEAEEQAKREAEEQAQRVAQEQAQQVAAQEKAKREAAEQAKREAADK
jgi:translation initiation factor IF-2